MFEATKLNRKNLGRQRLYRNSLATMTGILILPVLLILGTLLYKGAPAFLCQWRNVQTDYLPVVFWCDTDVCMQDRFFDGPDHILVPGLDGNCFGIGSPYI